MNRRKFISNSTIAGTAACAAICFGGVEKCIAQTVISESKETPCDTKMDFAHTWIKRFMNNLNSELDEKTVQKIMEQQGKACYLGSLEYRKIKPEEVEKVTPEQLIKGINDYCGEEAAVLKDNLIDYRYVKNPSGLRVDEGYCLCPFVEKGPEGLSGAYCNCSVGYVGEMFTTYLKTPVKVELLESLKRGGKTCRFKITLS